MTRVNPEEVGLDGHKLSRIDDLFKNCVGSDPVKKEIPGIGVRIIRKGKIAFDNYYGFIDAEESAPVTEDSVFRVYSMTKPVVSAAAMKLFEQGAFTLNDPVKLYIPAFNDMKVLKTLNGDSMETEPAKTDITVRHLLTMTSGLSYGFFPETDKLDACYMQEMFNDFPGTRSSEFTDEEFVDRLGDMPLAFQPGTDYRYGFSMDVIGRLIEVVSGMSLSDYLESEIFIPLGMNDTGFFVTPEQQSRLTKLYSYYGDIREEASGLIDHSAKSGFQSGGGGLVSTTGDYSKFCMMLLNKGTYGGAEIMGRKTVDLMTANHLSGRAFETFFGTDTPGYGYGLGVRTLIEPAKAAINGSPGEFGWSGAAGTWVAVDPMEDLCALYMVQSFPSDYYPLRRKFVQILYSALR